MPSPTLSELHAAVIEWAGIDRGNGSILSRANPVGQAAKTLEEIGEAMLALGFEPDPAESRSEQIYDECWREHQIELELGDILVTLCIQAHMQGTSLSEIIPYQWNGWAPDGIKRTWENVEAFGEQFYSAVAKDATGTPEKLPIYSTMLSLYACVTNAAVTINRTSEQCLDAAYNKIKDRSGHINEQGQLVKAS